MSTWGLNVGGAPGSEDQTFETAAAESNDEIKIGGAPGSLDMVFADAVASRTWSMLIGGAPSLDQAFEAAATAWTPTYGGGPVSMLFDNWGAVPPAATGVFRTLMGVGI